MQEKLRFSAYKVRVNIKKENIVLANAIAPHVVHAMPSKRLTIIPIGDEVAAANWLKTRIVALIKEINSIPHMGVERKNQRPKR